MSGKLAEELAKLRKATETMTDGLALAELNEDESRLSLGELWEAFAASPGETAPDSEGVEKALRFLRRYGLESAQLLDGYLRMSSWGLWFVPTECGDELSPGSVHLGHWTNQRVRVVFVGPVKEGSE